ncbi:MAG: Mur ligase family protein [Coriobacteriia bacterium]|nr:Mur ligase family protein [Coriobacteriia bacterium]
MRGAYDEALALLRDALTFGIHPSLDAITAMADELGRPQDAFVSIQVTGTNGKSSTARLIAALLAAHGLRTGLYTSPELHDYTERIEIDGEPITRDQFAEAIFAARDAAAACNVSATEFELLTAAALWQFRQSGVRVAVLEVGMGGRWDATSVVSPTVAVITGVGIDHAAHLGTTREQIAFDKAHIIKQNSVAVLGPGTVGVEQVLLERAQAMRAQVRAVRPHGDQTPVVEGLTVRYAVQSRPTAPDDPVRFDIEGTHVPYADVALTAPAYQVANAATAVSAAEAFLGRALEPAALAATFAAIRLPGRFEILAREPWVIADGAHNPEAAATLAAAVHDAWPDSTLRPVALLGVLADKDAEGIIAALAPAVSGFVCVAPDSPRALPAAALAAVVERVTGERPRATEDSVAHALEELMAMGRNTLVTGSLRTVAEAAPAIC